MTRPDWEVIEGDALDTLLALDVQADAVLMDPPYCSGAISEAGRKGATHQGIRAETAQKFGWFEGDNLGTAGLAWLLRSIGVAASRLVVDGGWLLVFADWRMISSLQPAIESGGWTYRTLIVWAKPSMALGVGFRAQHEVCLAFTRGQCAPRVFDKGVGNVIQSKRAGKPADRLHPTEKPVDVLDPLVRVVSEPGGLVIDPFCGSGSTGEAALRRGRRFLGVERAPHYAETARRRLAAIGQVIE